MPKFRIEQNYTEVGTHYYEVEANSLEEAIEQVENLEHKQYDTDVSDFDCDYEGSEEIKNE